MLNTDNLIKFDVLDYKKDEINLTSNLELNINLKENSSYKLEVVILPSNKTDIEINGFINVGENATLEVLLVDFSFSNVKVSIKGDLLNYSNTKYQVASVVDNSHFKKVYDINLNAIGLKTRSLVKMNGVLKEGEMQLLGATNIIKGAKKSVARQEGKIINLSKNSKAQVSPMLNIYENDINASHGAALGQIPNQTLFYLMSRGISKQVAIKLITIGLLKPFINMLGNKEYVAQLTSYIDSKETN